jgi:alkanesulfonate monooxygenase SsuD/methylene tetrahydromethanopterin reductase-like flavin-dependent oxidoreductase (luciferase family)
MAERTGMAFIRKRGHSYYLVHNVREDGRVRQIHLARLGRRPRISDDVVRGVASRHPFVEVDWEELRKKASSELVQPFENDARQLRDLLASIHNLHLDIGDLHLPVLEMTHDRELVAELTSSLKLLRATLDVKLNQLRRGRAQPYAG